MGAIVWLASYPKSGNTWVRAFLTNYRLDRAEPASINELEAATIASARRLFDELVGVESSDLTSAEIARYRPALYRRLAAESDSTLFVKVHDAYRRPDAGDPLFPREITAQAIYILRNPLDVVVSLAHHNGASLDRAVRHVCEGTTLSPTGGQMAEQLDQEVRSWGEHVCSWVDEPALPVHVVRYEDLVRQPLPAFAAIAAASGYDVDEDRVARAVARSSFDVLSEQERAHGFRERSPRSTVFFRSGKVGAWREALSPAQVRQVTRANGETMRRFGYPTRTVS